jgi:hypothetical protein
MEMGRKVYFVRHAQGEKPEKNEFSFPILSECRPSIFTTEQQQQLNIIRFVWLPGLEATLTVSPYKNMTYRSGVYLSFGAEWLPHFVSRLNK